MKSLNRRIQTFQARLVNAWRALRGLPPSTIWRLGDTPVGWWGEVRIENGVFVGGILNGPTE